jgi:DNA replication protein DnaC
LIAKRDLKLARVLKRLGRYDAVLIDDIGYVQQSREEMEVLFSLLAWIPTLQDRPNGRVAQCR